MRFLLLLLLFLPLRLPGAPGDIRSVAVETNGWQVLVEIDGVNTGGTYITGLSTNDTVPNGDERLVLMLRSQGFTTNAQATIHQRILYATGPVRKVYPQANEWDEDPNAGDVIIRLALSERIFREDTSITADIAAGLYTEGGVSNRGASGVSVINNSVQTYDMARPVINWVRPGWNRETNSTMRLEAMGIDWSAANGQPLACMMFVVGDRSGNITTNIVSRMSWMDDFNDELPFGKYAANVDLSAFASLEPLRCDIVGVPTIGNTNSWFDTRDNRWSGATWQPTSITNLCDRLGSYTDAVAVVGTAGANPSVTNVPPDQVSTEHYFGTIATALNAAASYNGSNFEHNDVGGAVIYVRSGVDTYPDGTVTATATPMARVTFAAYPGDRVTLTTHRGTQDFADRIKFEGVSMAWASGQVPFYGIEQLWIANAPSLTSVATHPVQECPVVWITGSNIGDFAQGLRPIGVQNTAFLLRGNNLSGFNSPILATVMVGNSHPDTNGPNYTVQTDMPGQSVPRGPFLIYNNFFGGSQVAGATFIELSGNFDLEQGGAFLQNVVEYSGTSTANNAIFFCADDTLNYTNLIVANCVIAGRRSGKGYTDVGTSTVYREHWTFVNTIEDVPAVKGDLLNPANGNRWGYFPLLYGVNFAGNFHVHCNIDHAVLAFPMDFPGIGSYQPSATNIINFPNYTDRSRANSDNQTPTGGGGNYKPLSPEPLATLARTRWVLPYDLVGVPRNGHDPPGAYALDLALAPSLEIDLHQPRIATNEVLHLIARVSGHPSPDLQWYLDGMPVAGQTNRELRFEVTGASQLGNFSLMASNSAGVEQITFPPVELATLSPRPGSPDPAFDRPLVPFVRVSHLLPLPDGGVLVGGGDDPSSTGAPWAMIGRLHPNGSLNTAFGEDGIVSGNGLVESLRLLPEDGILVAGWFTELAGTAAHGLAELTAGGQLVPRDFPRLDRPHVSAALRMPDGRTVIAGRFSEVNGNQANRLVRLHTDLSLDPSFNSPLEPWQFVDDLEIDARNRLLVAGERIYVVGNVTNPSPTGLRRLLEDGSPDPTFQPVTRAVRRVIVEPAGTLLTGPPPRRVDTNGQLIVEFESGPGAFDSRELDPDHRLVRLPGGSVVAPQVESGSVSRFELVRWNANGKRDHNFKSLLDRNGTIPYVEALALLSGGALLVSTLPPGEESRRLIRIPPDSDLRLHAKGVAEGEFKVQLATQPGRWYEIRLRIHLNSGGSSPITVWEGDGYVRELSITADEPMQFLELHRN